VAALGRTRTSALKSYVRAMQTAEIFAKRARLCEKKFRERICCLRERKPSLLFRD